MANLDRVRELIMEERFQDAYNLLASDPAGSDIAETHRLMALACMRMNKYVEAAKHFEIVCEGDTSGDSEDWYNLAMARLLGGDAVHGIIALEGAKQRYVKGRGKMTVPMMLFYFIGGLLDVGMWDAAKRYLQELAEIYAGLGRAGDSYLFANNLPYFSWFLNAVVTAYRSSRSQQAGITWLKSLASRFDQEGQNKIANAIRMLSGPQAPQK